MEFSHITGRLLSGCLVAFTFVASGCGQSGGYVDYASLPGPLVAALVISSVDSTTEPNTEPEQVPGTHQNSEQQPAAQTGEVSNNGDSPAPSDASKPPSDQPKTVTETETAAGNAGPSGSDVQQVAAVMTDTASKAAPAILSESAGTAATPQSSEPLEIQLLVPERSFRAEGDGDALRVSYDDIDLLKILNMEPVPPDAETHFPEWLRRLDGRQIRIRGFMYPTFKASGLTGFTLARDNGICCFVRQPKVYDVIGVKLVKGETSNYIDNKPFDVEGTFRIVPEADDTELFQLYRIENARVLN